MINLLSEIEKKSIEKENMVHLLTVIIFMIFVVSLLMLALLVPTLLINNAKERIALKTIEDLKKSESFLIEQDINNKIKEINTQLSFFNNEGFKVAISEDAIRPSINEKKSGVSIINMIYNAKDAKSGILTIHGFADKRESLLRFVDALKKVSRFSNVNLPVSDFVKGKDLPFTIILTVSI